VVAFTLNFSFPACSRDTLSKVNVGLVVFVTLSFLGLRVRAPTAITLPWETS